MLCRKSLDIGAENFESIFVMFAKNLCCFLGKGWKVYFGRRTMDCFCHLRVIHLAAYTAAKQMGQNKYHGLEDLLLFGINVGTEGMEVSTLE